ncbi:trap dicarboxylate transporter- dctp subunit [Roseibium sp. TrichSKD4]|uniref:TRAP transporter substrate-binding protein n=1 Tax=Roseibium sp. TrichSKD4 TaxID=744980 RepID=UPI0001E5645E|nr:TRAP transporter substrate-binding protein [Roseibium sp. TrichSKD4]EFO34141.1 trap dicarboxylate transporter- dctp subunit [Roseibium sp. TrichSKD4]
MIKKFMSASLGAFVAATTLWGGAASAETTLNLSSWLPPSHPIVADMIVPWTQEVEKATGGNVKIKILPKPLGKPPAHFDIAKDGLADVSYGVHGYQPGRFVMTKAVEMPFLGDSATATSVAYWRIHEKHFAQFNEHRGVKLLSLFTHGPGHIFNSSRPIEKLADLEGLKIRVGGGVVNDVAKSIGATALLKPAPQSYELMSAGVADGVFFPQESIKSFKLTGLVKHGTLIPGGLYNTSFFLVMNPRTFDKLSAEDQAAIMSVSGENFSRIAGKGWDDADGVGHTAMEESGIALINASDELVAEIKERTSAVEAAWVDAVKEKGLDGAAVMNDLRAEIANASGSN